MPSTPFARALAGVALCALALAPFTPSQAQLFGPRHHAQPSPAPSALPGLPTPQPSPTIDPQAIPLPSVSAFPAQTLPSAPPIQAVPTNTSIPSAAPTMLPVSPSAIPSLPPADQAPPLPYPAYGTPSPVNAGSVPPSTVPQIVTLQQAVLIAYALSPLLAEARAAVQVQEGQILVQRAAALPQLSGSVSSGYDRSQNTAGNAGTGTGTGTSSRGGLGSGTSNSASLSLSQLIYDGGRVAALVREAEANRNSALATYGRTLQTIAYNVSTAYYNTLNAERQTQVDLATVQLDLVQENLVAASIRAGTEARSDLATAQLATAQARFAVIGAQSTQLQGLATFANALGLDANTDVQPKDDVPALSVTNGALRLEPMFPTPTYAQAVQRAYLLRPDLAEYQYTVVAAQEAVKAARAGYFPTLALSGSYGIASTDSGGGAFRNAGSIGLGLSIPILNGGATRGEVISAQGSLASAEATFEQQRLSVQLNVKQALVVLVAAYASLNQANQQLQTAQVVLSSTEAQFRAGVTTLPLLLNAQIGITTALTNETTAVYSVRQAEQALLYAEGANIAG